MPIVAQVPLKQKMCPTGRIQSGGAYAGITRVATTIVMVVGDNNSATAQVRDSLRKKIAVIVRFDEWARWLGEVRPMYRAYEH